MSHNVQWTRWNDSAGQRHQYLIAGYGSEHIGRSIPISLAAGIKKMPLSDSLCRVPWNDGLKMVQTRITNEWIVSRFDQIYPIYRMAFARLLVTLRRDFDGDLDAMVVLLTLSLGTDREGWAQALLGNHVASTEKGVTNTQSIALASGIPRESVRRKLYAMEMRGWISRDEKGNWAPTPGASKDLRASSQETISFIRAIAAAAISADPDRPQNRPSPE